MQYCKILVPQKITKKRLSKYLIGQESNYLYVNLKSIILMNTFIRTGAEIIYIWTNNRAVKPKQDFLSIIPLFLNIFVQVWKCECMYISDT